MCLTINIKETDKYFKENGHRKFVKVKKLLYMSPIMGLLTPHRCSKINEGWFIGEPKFDISPYSHNEIDKITDNAIHVYQNNVNYYCSVNEFMIQAYALMEDFLACGYYNDIAFKKIYLPKIEIKRIEKLYAS